MNTRHLVDPELTAILDQFPKLHLTTEDLPMIRANSAAMAATIPVPDIPNLAVSERHVPGPEGAPDVRVLLYQPTQLTQPTAGLVWIHGGGYISGSADADSVNTRVMASQLGCVIVSVDYRLAPETPHPGPVEDCYAALRWLHANAAELGVDTGRLAIGGASAGGGLAAGLALLTRDRGEIPLAFQVLIFPMLDDRTVTLDPPHPYTGEFIWTAESNRFGWTALLDQEPGSEGVSPYAAAARAEDLSGLPAAYISVGALDLFLEENLEYARRLIRAGVPTAQVTQQSARDQMNAIRRVLKL